MSAVREVLCVPVISTAHVTEADMERLTDAIRSDSIPGAAYAEGAWVWVPSSPDRVGEDDDEETYEGMPSVLRVVRWARKQGFHFVRLDRDADEVSDLPSYEW